MNIKMLSTLELNFKFNEVKDNLKSSISYVNSYEVLFCDSHNVYDKAEKIEGDISNMKYELRELNKEIVFRVYNYGKQVDIYDKNNNIINAYIIPKKYNKNDSIGFVICDKYNSYSIHSSDNFKLLKPEEVKNEGYYIARDSNNKIKWNSDFVKYDSVYWLEDFDDEMNYIEKYAIVEVDNKVGIINKDDEEVLPLIHQEISNFYMNFAKIKFNDKWALTNRNFEFLTEFKYDSINFHNIGAITYTIDGKKGHFNKDGNKIINEYIYQEDVKVISD